MAVRLRIALALCATFVWASGAQAQAPWPNKPVKIMVPTAPGGTADNLARMLAQHMNKVTGQQFYVENRGGAGNIIGIEAVARSPADGYTFLVGAGTIAMNHVVYRKLPYDLMRDLTPVTQLISVPNMLVVHPSLPVKTLGEFIALAKAKPGQITYGSAGAGSNLHLAMELLKFRAGIDIVHVPYKGAGPALTDTIAGQIQSMIATMPAAAGHIRGNRIRALGVSGAKRSPAFSELPTIAEAGVPNYDYSTWYGVLGPRALPAPMVQYIASVTNKVLSQKDMRERLAQTGMEVELMAPELFAEVIKNDVARWGKIIKAAGIKPQ